MRFLRKRPVIAAFAALIVIFFILALLLFIRRYAPGTSWTKFSDVYDIEEDETAVFINNEFVGTDAFTEQSWSYISIDIINEFVNAGFYYSDEGTLLYALPLSMVTAKPGEKSYYLGVGQVEADYEIFKVIDGKAYICLDFVQRFTDIEVSSYNSPLRIMIFDNTGAKETALMKKYSYVRTYAGIKSPILCEAAKGERVEIIESVDKWFKIRTESGYIGYVKANTVFDKHTEVQSGGSLDYEYTSVSKDYKQCVVWHQIFSEDMNAGLEEYLEGTNGITVVSPTWFSISDNSGNFSSLADKGYVDKAHERGIEVWALIDDFNMDLDRYALFYNTQSRKKLISGLMEAYELYGFDGINIDFEKIDSETAPHYLEFIRELSIECRSKGIVLSVDNYIPSGGRRWYNISEQSRIVDYVIIMGYDEHWKGCEPGSNATLSFTENGISKTAEMVPEEKIIYALPFFMRVWTEIPESLAGEDAVIFDDESSYFGRYAVTSEAVGMPKAQKLIEENNIQMEWKDEIGQYYGEYMQDDTLIRLWLEDAQSIKTKLEVIGNYNVAGTAYWKLGLETADVWPVISSWSENE